MNTNLSKFQIEIIFNLLIDTCFIYNSVKKSFINDYKFIYRLESIINYCRQMYIAAENNNFTDEMGVFHIVKLCGTLDRYCNEYKNILFYKDAYNIMNLLSNKTWKVFNEYILN